MRGETPRKRKAKNMDNYTQKAIDSLENRVTPVRSENGKICAKDVIENDDVVEQLVFAMKDKTHDFTIGLDIIIECLKIAEDEGCVPKLPESWWNDVNVM